MSKKDKIKGFLLPREKYAEVKEEEYGEGPYKYIKRGKDKSLFYFGANHSRDPENHQYPILKEFWREFLEETEGREKIVLIEGGLSPLEKTEQDAIKKGAEPRFVTFLANKENIEIKSPDVSPIELAKKSENYSKEQILLRWFLAFVDGYKRQAKPLPSFEKEFEKWRKFRESQPYWSDIDISLENMKKLYKEVIGKDFNETKDQNKYINPNRDDSLVNKISREGSDLREIHIVSEIKRYWDKGISIFVVFGSGHLIIQKPALEKILK